MGYLIGPGANLSAAKLSGADLRTADLSHKVNLKGAYLTGANLSGNDLRNADFTSARMSGANLSGTWLQGAIFKSATLANANITSVSGCSVNWGKQSTNGSQAWTTSYTIRGDGSQETSLPTDLDGARNYSEGDYTTPRRDCMSGVRTTCGWSTGSIHNPPWSATIMCGVSFAGANLTGATITGMLPSADFTGATLTSAKVGTTGWAVLNGAKFTSAKLSGAKIDGGLKYYATFRSATTSSTTNLGNARCTTSPNGRFNYSNGYWSAAGTFVHTSDVMGDNYCPYPSG